jgi:deoxyadenosine/deoxycytidine kinase
MRKRERGREIERENERKSEGKIMEMQTVSDQWIRNETIRQIRPRFVRYNHVDRVKGIG